jgi:hypothetical protein
MHNNARTFTDAERADLVSVDEGGERRLMHPALGFSFRHPGPGFVSNGSPPSKPGTQFYAFTDREQGVTLGIGLFKGDGDSPTSLRKLLELLGRETTSLSAPPKTPARVVELETAADMPPRGSLHVALGDGRHYRVRGQGWRSATGSSFAILISVTSRTPDAGDDILASFRPPATER